MELMLYHVSFCSVVLCSGIYHEVVVIIVAISVMWWHVP